MVVGACLVGSTLLRDFVLGYFVILHTLLVVHGVVDWQVRTIILHIATLAC